MNRNRVRVCVYCKHVRFNKLPWEVYEGLRLAPKCANETTTSGINRGVEYLRSRDKMTEGIVKFKGREPNLTTELQNRICEIIANGNYITTACDACGIGVSTYYAWLDKANDPDNVNVGLYLDFVEAIKIAESKSEQSLVENVVKAGKSPQYWAASMTMLERRFPDKYARIDRIQSIQKVDGVINVIHHIPRPIPEIGEGNGQERTGETTQEETA